MPKKKEAETKQNNIPKEIDNNQNNETDNEKLSWVQILLLLGKPLWDAQKKKWRVLSGYQAVLGYQNNKIYFEVTFTDTPNWENFIEKQLYIDIPKKQEEHSNNGNKNSNKKSERIEAEDEK